MADWMPGLWTVALSITELFTHIHYVRLVFVFEDAPEFARKVPEKEWAIERDPDRIAQMLNESGKAVREAVSSRVETGQNLNLHYDHPILLLQHMLWHEGYHHGQNAWRDGEGPAFARLGGVMQFTEAVS